jgi:ferredoxin
VRGVSADGLYARLYERLYARLSPQAPSGSGRQHKGAVLPCISVEKISQLGLDKPVALRQCELSASSVSSITSTESFRVNIPLLACTLPHQGRSECPNKSYVLKSLIPKWIRVRVVGCPAGLVCHTCAVIVAWQSCSYAVWRLQSPRLIIYQGLRTKEVTSRVTMANEPQYRSPRSVRSRETFPRIVVVA